MASMGRALVSHGGGARYLLENDQIPRRGQRDCGMLGAGGGQRPSLCGPARPLVAEAGTAEAPGGPVPTPRFCLARGHTGHRLGAHAHVHATPQHRDQAAAVHQVSGRRGRAQSSQGEPPWWL